MKSLNIRMTTVAVAMCLGLAAGSANAALMPTPVFGSWAGDEINGYTAVFSNNSVGSTFDDWFNFSIPVASSGSGGSVAISNFINSINWNWFNVTFSAFNLFESDNLIASGSTDNFYSALTFSNQAAPGNYSLNVAGSKINATQSGGYSGTVTVSAVPEPETYGMLLAGLGLIGFTARRRKRNI